MKEGWSAAWRDEAPFCDRPWHCLPTLSVRLPARLPACPAASNRSLKELLALVNSNEMAAVDVDVHMEVGGSVAGWVVS